MMRHQTARICINFVQDAHYVCIPFSITICLDYIAYPTHMLHLLHSLYFIIKLVKWKQIPCPIMSHTRLRHLFKLVLMWWGNQSSTVKYLIFYLKFCYCNALFFHRGLIFAYFAENENSAKIKPAEIQIRKSHCRSVGAVCMHACILYYTHKICLICYPCLLKSMKYRYYTLL